MPVKAGPPGQPQMTAGEALELLRAWRPGALATAEDEEHVQQFALEAWSKQVQKAQQAFRGSAAFTEKKVPSASGKVFKQPGDGNCLFHSLAYALGGSAASIRTDVCMFMERSPDLTIAGTSLTEWIQMLAGVPIKQYTKKMSKSGNWGGAPELAACAHMKNVNIHVYERRGNNFELTVPFDVGGGRTITVLYVGGVHYDA